MKSCLVADAQQDLKEVFMDFKEMRIKTRQYTTSPLEVLASSSVEMPTIATNHIVENFANICMRLIKPMLHEALVSYSRNTIGS
jgi:hypothetical protein